MSQWAREHPELYDEGVTAYDHYAERGDQLRQERKDGLRCPNCLSAGAPEVRAQDEFGNWLEACEDEWHERGER